MQDATRNSANLWSGLALAALGIYIMVQALQWEYATPEGPGPGFFPLWYGIAMLALSAVLVVSELARRSTRGAAIEWKPLGRALSTWLAVRGVGRASQAARLRDQLRAADLLHRRRHVPPSAENSRARGGGERGGILPRVPARARRRPPGRCAVRRAGLLAVEILAGFADGLAIALAAGEPVLVLRRRRARHRGGNHARARTAGDDRDAAAR